MYSLILLKSLRFSALIMIGLMSLDAQATTAPVDSDTYLDASNAIQQQKNFGKASSVDVSLTKKALLSFKLSALPSAITVQDVSKATLFFYVQSVSATGKLQISPVNSPWQEQTVTYKTAPFQDAVIASSATVTRNQAYFAVDVTQLIKNWLTTPSANFGLAIEPDFSTPTTTISFDSKETRSTSHAPYLDIVLTNSGIKGDKGDKGDTGPVGPQGQNGAKGDTGLTGAAGIKGDKGDPGATKIVTHMKTSDPVMAGNFGVAQVLCDQGETATGGGFIAINAQPAYMHVVESRSIQGIPSGWYVGFWHAVGDPEIMTVAAYVLCASL